MSQNIIDLIIELQQLDIKIDVDGDKISGTAPDGVMTQEIMDKIANNKAALIDFLKKNSDTTHELEPIIHDEDNRYEPFPLTDVQQAYWVGRSNEFELGNVATHMYMEFEERHLNIENLEMAWNGLIKRHDMLRAIVHSNGMQQVLKEVPHYEMAITDFGSVEDAQTKEELLRIRDEMSHQVMPADKWPLFDVRLSKLKDDNYRIHMSIDLLIADALSWQILFKELTALYVNPNNPLAPIDVSFRDFVYAERALKETKLYEKALDYWRDYIKDLPGAPELPLIKNPSMIEAPHFVRRQAALDEDIWQSIQQRALKEGFTASAVLMQAYSMVLANWSKNPRFCINLTLFNRLPLHENINQVIGDFTSLTLLEFDNNYTESFKELTTKVQQRLWKNLDNRYVSGVQVMREINNMHGGSHAPVMPVVFTSDLAHVSSRMLKEVYGVSQTPQVWIDHQVIEQNGKLVLNWDCVDELFPEGMLDAMFTCYTQLLNRLGQDEKSWQCSMGQLINSEDRLCRHEKERKSIVEPGQKLTLNQLFSEKVDQQPHHVALITESKTLTYQALGHYANQIGRYVREHNHKPLVGVVMKKGWEQIVAVMGILQGGFAYLPISADLPNERINYLLQNGDVELVLTQSHVRDNMTLPNGVKVMNVDQVDAYTHYSLEPLPQYNKPQDLAYVIYTSGSTGHPKGVVITHQAAINTILDINSRFEVTPEDRVFGISELNFDLSVYDIFGTFAGGGTLVLPLADRRKDPEYWLDIMDQEKVTLWNSVPALMEMLVQYTQGLERRLPPSLRLVLLSGDWIPLQLPEELRQLTDPIDIISLGGATEASIWSNFYRIDNIQDRWKSIPYGKALSNQTMYVMDSDLKLREDWVTGKIYIGGLGLAKGYLNDLDTTNRKFIIHPVTKERLYDTGDIGRYLPDGNIEFLGREDFQVKINGHRIELGEIENVMDNHPLIANSVVDVFDNEGRKSLVAYVVQERGKGLEGQTKSYTDLQGIVEDPVERLKFKLAHKNHRQLDGEKISLEEHGVKVELGSYIKRRSYRSFSPHKIQSENFLALFQSFRQMQLEDTPMLKSLYASAGSLYPVQIYVYIKENKVEGIEGGTYYYHPQENAFYVLTKGAGISPHTFPMGNREIFEGAGFAIFLVGSKEAIEPMYGNWSRDFMYLEAGLMSQLFEMTGPNHNIGLCQIGNYDFEQIAHWFQFDNQYQYLHCLLGGQVEEQHMQIQGLIEDSQDVIEMAKHVKPEDMDKVHQISSEQEPAEAVSLTAATRLDETSSVATKVEDVQLLEASWVEDIRHYMSHQLPDYMIPSHFIIIDKLPLSANGKINRKQLPLPLKIMKGKEKGYVEPTTALEKKVANIWCGILEREKVGIHDNLFEIGGNSVDIVKIYNEMNRLLQEEEGLQQFKIKDFFNYPTIKAICDYMDKDDETSEIALSLIEKDCNMELPEVKESIEDAKTTVSNLFITGATGYLGAHIVYEVMKSTDCRAYCLVREKEGITAKERLRRQMIKLNLWEKDFESRIEIVIGELEAPKFGHPKTFEALTKSVDSIIHCASWVNFVYPYEALRQANVESLDNIMALASTYRVKPINFISSLTAFPLTSYKDEPIDEDFLCTDYNQLVNGYSQSKWVGEHLLNKLRQRQIPVSIFRPAFIYGHSQKGTCNEKDLIWAVIKSIIQFKSFTDLGDIQLVSVDYVSKMLVKASMDPVWWNKNYNLITPEPIKFKDIFYLAQQMGYDIEQEYPRIWMEKVGHLSPDNALSNFLPFFENITGEDGEEKIGSVQYEDKHCCEIRKAYAIESNGLNASTLAACMHYLTELGYIDKPKKSMEDMEKSMEDTMEKAIKERVEERVEETRVVPLQGSIEERYTTRVKEKKIYDSKNYSLWNPFSDMEELVKHRNFGPSNIVRAEGPYIYNAKGQRFLNAASSLWNVAVGHGREEIVQAAAEQMRELAYSSCFRQTHPRAMELADKLVEITDYYYTHVYLGSNGSEAIETALKMTRQYYRQSPDEEERKRYKILSLRGAYHGVTYGAISTSGDEDDNAKYGPLLPGFNQVEPAYCYRCPYGQEGCDKCQYECVQALEDLIIQEDPSTCAAFILEPIMGVHGIVSPPLAYYDKVGELCKKYKMLLIADEVTTGFGRTGKLFNSMDWAYRPDILVSGKGISSGYLPLSATMATEAIYQRFIGKDKSFSHGSTASGHPVCAAVGIANIDIMMRENLVSRAQDMGDYILAKLKELQKKHDIIGDVRGRGLMIGIELVKDKETKEPLPQKEVFKILMDCFSMGVYVYLAPNLRTLGLFPPLVIDKTIADELITTLDTAFQVGIKSAIGRTGRFIKSNILNNNK